MSGFPAKMVLVLVAVYLLLGFLPATSALLSHAEDGEKSLWHVDCRHGLMKILGRKEGYFGGQNGFVSKKIVPTRSLRVMVTSKAPPSPVKNKATSQHVTAAPPSSIA
ncbi:hypothetical protein RchiOBHm_Chr7g0192821 [Rosa chinensis]|uniref:Uncharacterized protein n=1 Tax=Rosa chinensis TaxID=74649 RepID=A0A2P6P5P3_ROSCH|nr:hypothetical protein RchiOBHm_Chr7g0192821 [Rosa chinensis]